MDCYFDANNGSDTTGDGLSPATAWQTLAMASSAAVTAGSWSNIWPQK